MVSPRCFFRPLALLALFAASAASAAPPHPLSDPLAPSPRDYVDGRRQPKAPRIVFPGTPCSPCWGEVVQYTAFYEAGVTYAARRYDGHAVTLLVPVTHPRAAQVTEQRLRTLVDRLDILYASYVALLGWEPSKGTDPMGKQVFAVLPTEPSWFYGLAYVPGDSSEYSNAVLDESGPDDDVLGNVWVHELAHNFDPIGHWDYGPDPAHDWTTLFQTWYARQQMRMDEYRTPWSAVQENWLANHWTPWLADAALTWSACAATTPRPAACNVDGGRYLVGSLGVVLGREVDGRFMRDWLRLAMAERAANVTLANDAAVRSDYQLRLLAQATESDVRCIAAPLRWHAGPSLDGLGWTTAFAGCRDGDGDGTPRFDDCDDAVAAVEPGAPELADGIDNDCDGVVDERLLRESDQAGGDFSNDLWNPPDLGRVPLLIQGALATGADRDSVGFDQGVPSLQFRLCATGGRVSVAGVTGTGVAWGPLASADAGRCTAPIHRNDGHWVSVALDAGGSGNAASYELLVAEPADDLWPRPRALRLLTHADGLHAEVRDERIPAGDGEVRVRWLLSGAGFVQDLPLSNPASLLAPALTPAQLDNPQYPRQLRAQLWRESMPIEEPSYPVTVNRPAYALTSGQPFALRLAPGRLHPRLFVDVPAGATRLTVSGNASAGGDLDLLVSPTPAPASPWPGPTIAATPDPAAAPHRGESAGSVETIVIEGAALTPGRWYVAARNDGAAAIDAQVRVDVVGSAPIVRPGSYFDSDRGGHGLFLYPAGDQWAGLWYTYHRDSTPTWYYLQGAAPGANGIWQGALYRSRWNGSSNQLTRIGEALVTPTAADRFTFSFNMDGDTGSEPMQALGRGCPVLLGAPVDSSGNWFDPAHAGTGYSTQFWSTTGYQFFAGFVYDGDNEPRFVTTEHPDIGSAQQALPLEQLAGFCPLCVRRAAPTRRVIGELARRFEDGRLVEILVDADYVLGVPGTWSAVDQVQALGEATQGCEP